MTVPSAAASEAVLCITEKKEATVQRGARLPGFTGELAGVAMGVAPPSRAGEAVRECSPACPGARSASRARCRRASARSCARQPCDATTQACCLYPSGQPCMQQLRFLAGNILWTGKSS